MTRSSKALFLILALAACGGESANVAAAKPASPEMQKLVLTADPGEALGVVDAKLAGPADKVVVEGRIALSIVPGKASFVLMDTDLPYCGETNHEDTCPTPWDYCCDKPKIGANSMVVEARGADGQPLATPSLPNLRLTDKVKVTGKLTKDEFGNFVLVATGLFRVERPKLPDYVKWPQ